MLRFFEVVLRDFEVILRDLEVVLRDFEVVLLDLEALLRDFDSLLLDLLFLLRIFDNREIPPPPYTHTLKYDKLTYIMLREEGILRCKLIKSISLSFSL